MRIRGRSPTFTDEYNPGQVEMSEADRGRGRRMEVTNARANGAKGNAETAALQQRAQVQAGGVGAALVVTANLDSNLPQRVEVLGSGQVMTDEQLETLRRQISAYSTICHQLVELHKARVLVQSGSLPGVAVGQTVYDGHLVGTITSLPNVDVVREKISLGRAWLGPNDERIVSYPDHPHPDPHVGTKTTAGQRWTPIQNQLQTVENLFDEGEVTCDDPLVGTPHRKTTAKQRWRANTSQLRILEEIFDEGNGTPQKTRLKEIAAELSQHGENVAEANVYNWFQNRKARTKRKLQMVPTRTGESEVDSE